MKLDLLLLLGSCLAVTYLQTAFDGFRILTGVQPDFLPVIMVYAGLNQPIPAMAAVAVTGGLLLDSLSANPLGISVLPLLIAGLAVYAAKDLLLKDQPFAQVTLGAAAGLAVPVMTLLLLFTTGHAPLLGLGTLWQLLVLTAWAAAAAPVCFIVFDWLHRSLAYGHAAETSFRADREIRRGR